MKFKNPSNDYTEEYATSLSWLWVLLFGPIYWAVRGVWSHAVLNLVLAIVTCGLINLIYVFFTYSILKTSYRRKGWIEV